MAALYATLPLILISFLLDFLLDILIFKESIMASATLAYSCFYLFSYAGGIFGLFTLMYVIAGLLSITLARILFACTLLLGIMELYMYHAYKMLISLTSLSAILNTTPFEVYELFSLNYGAMLALLAAFFAIVVALYLAFSYLARRFYNALVYHLRYFYLLSFCMGLAMLVLMGLREPLKLHVQSYDVTSFDRLFNKATYIASRYQKHEKLHLRHALTLTSRPRDINVVLLIGESANRSHFSLYGYKRQTTPRLDALYKSGNIIKYTDVISPAIVTTTALKYALTLKSLDPTPLDKGAKDAGVVDGAAPWHKVPNLIDIFKDAGFRTFFISNQEGASLFIPLAYVEIGKLADVYKNTSPNIIGMDLAHYTRIDSHLFPLLDALKPLRVKSLLAVHLMGSHTDYKKRVEHGYARFSAKDYAARSDLDSAQKQRLSEYDNSIFYSDYILDTIYKDFADENTIIVFFSDHAEEAADNTDGYIGRRLARATVEVPFFIMTSSSFRAHHRALMERIKAARNRPYQSDDLLYLLMDIADIRYKEVQDKDIKSPLSSHYVVKKRSVDTLVYDK